MTQNICLNMIVKNESKVIRRALDSAAPHVHSMVIEDTGSTDNTVEICASYPNSTVIQHPWQNFEYNRNHALDWARQSGCDYVLFLDADDTLQFPPDFQWPQLTRAGYHIPVHYGNTRYGRCALINAKAPWYWKGVVHEYLDSKVPLLTGNLEWPHIVIVGGGARSQNPEKYLEDAHILEKYLEENPNDPRSVFYLAQSYRDAGQREKAITVYDRRAKMPGFLEENWFSVYQQGLLTEQLGQDPTLLYLNAYQLRPSRAEPLYQLARYHRCKQNYHLGYMFACAGEVIPLSSDVLFVDLSVYKWRILEEKALSSWYVGKKEEGKAILEKLIVEGKGDVEHYKNTMRLY